MSTAALPKWSTSLLRPIPAKPADYFSAEELERARSYRRPLQRAEILGTVISLVVMALLIGTEAARTLIETLGVTGWALQVVVAIALVIVVQAIAAIPISIWQSFTHEARWGFNTKTGKTFVRDEFTGLFVLTVLLSALLLPVWALIRATDLWWLWGALTMTAVTLLFGFIYPLVILPLSNRFTPLGDRDLVARLEAIAARAGVTVSEFSVMNASKRTKKDNAFVAGMGASRKVVIFDNLLASPAEHVESVVAHEIGHWRRGHIARGVLAQGVQFPVLLAITAAIVSFGPLRRWAGIEDLGDPAAIPMFLLALGVAQSLTSRGLSWFSRWLEREADLDSLELTGDPDGFRGAMHGLAVKNLPDIDPSWLARTKERHPPIAERLAFADLWKKERGSAQKPIAEPPADLGGPSV